MNNNRINSIKYSLILAYYYYLKTTNVLYHFYENILLIKGIKKIIKILKI